MHPAIRMTGFSCVVAACWVAAGAEEIVKSADVEAVETQVTTAADNHILTNIGVWSSDGEWIYYDVRSDEAGSVFDGTRIERIHVTSGRVETLYVSANGACCGVVTASPTDDRAVFIHGPEHPTADWSYAASRRRGVVMRVGKKPLNLDARDLVPPFTAGALRGGTHVHVFSGDGRWVSFTYEDEFLASSTIAGAARNQRNVGVAVPIRDVRVPRTHPRNHDGSMFSVLVTTTTDDPRPGSDEIRRAYSDAWVGRGGYVRGDGTRQERAIAFLGDLVTADTTAVTELYVVDIPDDLMQAGPAPLEGTTTTRPAPPAGTVQRRLTFTTDRPHPGIDGPRHWPRSAPDGSQIAFILRDDDGIAQLYSISPQGGGMRQITHNRFSVESAFSWHPAGRAIACIAGGSVCEVDTVSGTTTRLTRSAPDLPTPRPEACVYSPDGSQIAYVRRVPSDRGTFNQIFVVSPPQSP